MKARLTEAQADRLMDLVFEALAARSHVWSVLDDGDALRRAEAVMATKLQAVIESIGGELDVQSPGEVVTSADADALLGRASDVMARLVSERTRAKDPGAPRLFVMAMELEAAVNRCRDLLRGVADGQEVAR